MEKFHKNPTILNGGGKFSMCGGRCRCEEILRCAQDDKKDPLG